MVKRYYIQDYSENFRSNTETRTVASDFIRPSIESRGFDGKQGEENQKKEKTEKTSDVIAAVCTINKICTGQKNSRDTSEERLPN